MADLMQIKLFGAAETNAVIKALPGELSTKVYAQALRKGAVIVRDAAVAAAPSEASGNYNTTEYHRPGIYRRNQLVGHMLRTLKNSIKVIQIIKTDISYEYKVGVGKAFWGIFIEFGRKNDNARYKKVMSGGGQVYGKHVADLPAKPFMRPAFDSTKDIALNTVGKALGEGVEKAAAKLAGPLNKTGLLRRF